MSRLQDEIEKIIYDVGYMNQDYDEAMRKAKKIMVVLFKQQMLGILSKYSCKLEADENSYINIAELRKEVEKL